MGFRQLGEPGEALRGRTAAVQGVGNVGAAIVMDLLRNKGVKKVIACDINPALVDSLIAEAKNDARLEAYALTPFTEKQFYATECDIFSPNAVGATINQQNGHCAVRRRGLGLRGRKRSVD